MNAIDQTLYDAFGQRQIATVFGTLTQYRVILEVDPVFRKDPDILSKIYVTAAAQGTQFTADLKYSEKVTAIDPMTMASTVVADCTINYKVIGMGPGVGCTLTDDTEVQYKCTDVWNKDAERAVIWNSEEIGIKWPIPESEAVLSDKDRKHPRLAELGPQFL